VKDRGLQAFEMDMNPAPALSGHLAVDVVNKAIVNVHMFIGSLGPAGPNANPKQVALIVIAAVGIGDLQTIDFPKGRVLQQQTCVPNPVGANIPLKRLPRLNRIRSPGSKRVVASRSKSA